jgi:predicted hotdog family 3-hydroxylacyl-ACP dehydratase
MTHERAPLTLDRAGIAARVPHAGRMCLLDAMTAWSDDEIHCRIANHRDADHPLRTAAGLLAPCAIEYAAQATALHGALAASEGAAPSSGFIASARDVRLHVPRLDTQDGELTLQAQRLAGDTHQAMYRFALRDAQERLLVEGRVTVVLGTPVTLR